jgi:hypothetical protein
MKFAMAPDDHDARHEEQWRRLLAGEVGSVRRMRRVLGAIPSDPRCKLCAAPFGRPGNALLRLIGFGPSRLNRRLVSSTAAEASSLETGRLKSRRLELRGRDEIVEAWVAGAEAAIAA